MNDGNNPENKQSEIDKDNGVFGLIFDYFKDRIESPLFANYLMFWLFFNKNFFLYLFISEDYSKFEKISAWEFHYVTPLIAAILILLIIKPLNYILIGTRYYISTIPHSYALEQKNSHDQIKEKEKLSKDVAELNKSKAELESSIPSLNQKILHLSNEIAKLQEKYKNIKGNGEQAAELAATRLCLDSILYFNNVTEYKRTDEIPEKIQKNSLVNFNLSGEQIELRASDLFIRLLEDSTLKIFAINLAANEFRWKGVNQNFMSVNFAINSVWKVTPKDKEISI